MAGSRPWLYQALNVRAEALPVNASFAILPRSLGEKALDSSFQIDGMNQSVAAPARGNRSCGTNHIDITEINTLNQDGGGEPAYHVAAC